MSLSTPKIVGVLTTVVLVLMILAPIQKIPRKVGSHIRVSLMTKESLYSKMSSPHADAGLEITAGDHTKVQDTQTTTTYDTNFGLEITAGDHPEQDTQTITLETLYSEANNTIPTSQTNTIGLEITAGNLTEDDTENSTFEGQVFAISKNVSTINHSMYKSPDHMLEMNKASLIPASGNITEDTHKYIVIGGPHHTGTSLLRLLLGKDKDVSIQNASSRFEGEGQHVQTVYARARKVCEYAINSPPKFHMTEKDFNPNQNRIFKEWNRYWNLSKSILVEKSPPNILKSRWLQSLYDFTHKDAHFVFLMKHPISIMQSHCHYDPEKYIEHWLTIMETLAREIANLHFAYFIRFEDWLQTPEHTKKVVDDLLSSVRDPTMKKHARRNLVRNIDKRNGQRNIHRRQLKFNGNRKNVTVIQPKINWERKIDLSANATAYFEPRLNKFGYSLHSTNVQSEVLPQSLKRYLIS